MFQNASRGQRMKINRPRQREFITVLGGAVAWPFAAHAPHAMGTSG
jgi:hypothetical protein